MVLLERIEELMKKPDEHFQRLASNRYMEILELRQKVEFLEGLLAGDGVDPIRR